MATVVVSAGLPDPTDSSEEAVQIRILVREEDFVGLFNKIEVWRSRDIEAGPYEELTADTWRAARIPKTAGDEPATPPAGASAALVDKTLELLVGEIDELVVTFTGVDPLSFLTAAGQIESQGLGLIRSYVAVDGVLVVETAGAGTGASLRVVSGDAAPLLGLPIDEPDSLAFGRDARVTLLAGTESYLFTDRRGSREYFYRTRLRNQSTGSVSEFSLPVAVAGGLGISDSNLILGTLDVVGLDGKPAANIEVGVYNRFVPKLIESRLVVQQQQSKLTDERGHVEFYLVRGAKVTVAIAGTDIVRTIEVPTDTGAETFHLLDSDIAEQDVFTVQIPSVDYATRRSL